MEIKKITIIVIFLLIGINIVEIEMKATGEKIEGKINLEYRSISIYVPAVAETDSGYIGVPTSLTVTMQNGTGMIFVDTMPLTQIDMQGSARLAVNVADSISGIDTSNYDFFFVMRTQSEVIGGPSASAAMTIASIALLENWEINSSVMMTGMINPDGTIGPVGGIIAKLDAANQVNATRFLIPEGQGNYTEMETIRKEVGGGVQIIQKPVYYDVIKYAKEKYNIEAIEVSDVNEALLYTTGYQFKTKKSQTQVTTKDYENSMMPLSKDSLKNAKKILDDANQSFNNSKIPNDPPSYTKNQIKEFLDSGTSNLINAERNFNSKLFYSSLSNSFLSRINSRFVKYTSEYYESNDGNEYVNNLIKEANITISKKCNLATSSKISGVVTLQCIGGAQKRAFEAKKILENAKTDFKDSNILNSLYSIAYALERADSVSTWLQLSEKFNDTIKLDSKKINELANKYLESAEQSLLYSNLILSQTGTDEDTKKLLSDAEDVLSEAKKQILEGYPAASLFSSLEALVKGNLALELLGGLTDERLNKTKEQTLVAIEESRELGVEPVLAVSYYEYAQNFDFAHKKDAAVFYKYSRSIAKLSKVILEPKSSKKESRFVGFPPLPSKSQGNEEKNNFSNLNPFLIFCILFFAFVFGLLIGFSINQKKTKKSEEKHEILIKPFNENGK